MYYYKDALDSPIGRIYLAATDEGLVYCANPRENGFAMEKWLEKYLADYQLKSGSNQVLEKTKFQLEEYFNGERKNFDLPILLIGTEFRRKVWQALREIGYGETRSYGEIAKKIGKPKGSRAVGQANHHNPISYIVP